MRVLCVPSSSASFMTVTGKVTLVCPGNNETVAGTVATSMLVERRVTTRLETGAVEMFRVAVSGASPSVAVGAKLSMNEPIEATLKAFDQPRTPELDASSRCPLPDCITDNCPVEDDCPHPDENPVSYRAPVEDCPVPD